MKAMTLIELLIVIIIVGIVVTFAIPEIHQAKEHAIDKEAAANLKLIRAAERLYHIETSTYYASAAILAINDNLKLFLPAGAERNWDYQVKASGCAQADRTKDDKRKWKMAISDEEPVAGACS